MQGYDQRNALLLQNQMNTEMQRFQEQTPNHFQQMTGGDNFYNNYQNEQNFLIYQQWKYWMNIQNFQNNLIYSSNLFPSQHYQSQNFNLPWNFQNTFQNEILDIRHASFI